MLLDKLPFLYAASSWLSNVPASSKAPISVDDGGSNNTHFTWEQIEPTRSLEYHDCFDGFKCARLEVPMDWTVSSTEDNRTVQIAVIRLPATVPITDPRYSGAVVINPGGPGGSGVHSALVLGKAIRTVVSAGPEAASNETSRHFDVISFDPRGVNNTTPSLMCFPNHVQYTEFTLESSALGVMDASNAAFGLQWARWRGIASDCSKRAIESGIGEHMATASVARDIIEIFERHGEWRENQARALLSSPPLRRGLQIPLSASRKDVSDTLERVRYRPGEEMVQYWGFSYGTALGATLAAMYPKRISRAVFDGVVDSFDYMKGGWVTNLQDTDMQIIRFAEYCWLGGPESCALYDEDGPAVIAGKFAAVIERMRGNPISVPASGGDAGGVVTYSDLKNLFWQVTYNPLRNFHRLARVMNELRLDNGTGLAEDKFSMRKSLEGGLSDQCKKDGPYSRSCYGSKDTWDQTAGVGILCSDAEPQLNRTMEQYWEYSKELMGQSRLVGDVWATIMLPCTQWHARPKWRYEGNFTVKTAEPILFVSNTLDNVTPMRNAITMSKGFEGSGILQQDVEGHCSLASVSFCTMRAIRQYFQKGILPKKGTICLPARLPLDGFSEEETPALPEGETDDELWRAMVEMNK